MVRKIRHRPRHKHKSATEVFDEASPKKVRPGEDDFSTRYFVPEPVEEKTVDKDVTKFLLEESHAETKTEEREGQGRRERPSRGNAIDEPEQGKRDLTNWYVITTVVIIVIVLITAIANHTSTGKGEMTNGSAAQETGTPGQDGENATASVVAPLPNATTALKDFTLNITGLRTVENFRQLDNNLGDLVNECNRSERCKAALKGYRKVGLRTQSKSYTFTISKDGRIVDLRRQLESGTNFVMDASEEDLVALYNALAINDEETVLLKLQRILPPEVMLQAMQGMMAG